MDHSPPQGVCEGRFRVRSLLGDSRVEERLARDDGLNRFDEGLSRRSFSRYP